MKKDKSQRVFFMQLWLGTFILMVLLAMNSQGLGLAIGYAVFFSLPVTFLVSLPILQLLAMLYETWNKKK